MLLQKTITKLAEANYARILLVDDYESNVMIAGLYLDSFGYAYDIARSGVEAIEKVKTRQYSAILMDIQMPEMDGIEVTRRIRDIEAENGREAQPVIALTAHPLSGDRETCMEVGMDCYLSKPFDAKKLRELLDGYIHKDI